MTSKKNNIEIQFDCPLPELTFSLCSFGCSSEQCPSNPVHWNGDESQEMDKEGRKEKRNPFSIYSNKHVEYLCPEVINSNWFRTKVTRKTKRRGRKRSGKVTKQQSIERYFFGKKKKAKDFFSQRRISRRSIFWLELKDIPIKISPFRKWLLLEFFRLTQGKVICTICYTCKEGDRKLHKYSTLLQLTQRITTFSFMVGT